MSKRYKYTMARQWAGDDGYQWAVWVKGERLPRVSGLTRQEVDYYRRKFEHEEAEKQQKSN